MINKRRFSFIFYLRPLVDLLIRYMYVKYFFPIINFVINVPLIVAITEKVYFSAHSPGVSGAWKTRCKAWCFLCLGWRCHDNLLQDLRQRVTKLWRHSWKHSYCKMLRLFVMYTFNHGSTHFMLIWRAGGPITLCTTLFCWECTSLGKIEHYWNYEECYWK